MRKANNPLKIRLARWGARNNPFYGIVVTHTRAARDGRHLERLGCYNPIPQMDPAEYREYLLKRGTFSGKAKGQEHIPLPARKVKHVELNLERIKFWIGQGAQVSERVNWLFSKAGLMPQSPLLLHRTGKLDLNDMRTWDLAVKNKDGLVKALIKPREEIFKESYLPLKHTDIQFTGKSLRLNDQERNRVLKTFLGVC